MSINRIPQEVRDECRANRDISRSALVHIARKKQARAMMTAYNTLKTKLDKGKVGRKRRKTTGQQASLVIFDMLEKLKGPAD